MKTKPKPTYEGEALSVLVYEFSFSKKEESERKIKARLRRKKLGAFDAARIEPLRQLKDEVQREFAKGHKSSYYAGPAPTARRRRYAEMSDFDLPRLTEDLVSRYPHVPKEEIAWFVPFATFIYHML